MDYNKITNKSKTESETNEVIEEVVETEEVEEMEETIFGRVSNCNRLHIRKRPNKEAGEIVVIVDVEDLLMIIEPEKATGDWYKVIGEKDGKEFKGFCMKEFVTID